MTSAILLGPCLMAYISEVHTISCDVGLWPGRAPATTEQSRCYIPRRQSLHCWLQLAQHSRTGWCNGQDLQFSQGEKIVHTVLVYHKEKQCLYSGP